jgi:hypothetical protein
MVLCALSTTVWGLPSPQGSYRPTGTMDPSDNSIYAVGCRTPGQSTSQAQIDSRLRVGQLFDYNFSTTYLGHTLSASAQSRVMAINPTALSLNTAVFAVSGISGVRRGDTLTATCSASSDPFCVFSPAIPEISLPALDNCEFAGNPSPSMSADHGIFTTATGTTVNAYRVSVQLDGDFACGSQNYGHTALQIQIIKSNEVPSFFSDHFCGGVPVFGAVNIAPDTGPAIWTGSAEQTRVSQ